MVNFKKIVKQSLPVLLICIFGEILAGIFLLNIENYISILPGILILIPAVMGTRGNILLFINISNQEALPLLSLLTSPSAKAIAIFSAAFGFSEIIRVVISIEKN